MTFQQVYQVARNAGFPHATAVKMVAIAWKESNGNPTAYNGSGPDKSYGLWQINMIGALGPARRAQYGLAYNEQLYDPATNARIAFDLWGGNDANLDRHWGIITGGHASDYAYWLTQVTPVFSGPTGVVDVAASGGGGEKKNWWESDTVLIVAAVIGVVSLVDLVLD